MHTTNYTASFITISPDSSASAGRVPARPGSIAALQYAKIALHPYTFTSDDVIFGVHAERQQIAAADRAAARTEFFARGQACLRASPLVKTHGWGVHHDAGGRVALYGVETPEYADFLSRNDVKKWAGMRMKRASGER